MSGLGADFAAGAAMSCALISAQDLQRSLAFYCDVIGLERLAQIDAEIDVASETDKPRAARMALVGEARTHAGRILLCEFAERGVRIRQPGDRTTRGYWNLNFYVEDIDASTRDLRARGFEFWSDPETYDVGVEAGTAREVVFEGPDGVAINLVEPRGRDDQFTGRVRAHVARHGRTRTGYTPVVTSSHCVTDATAAVRFYRDVLGMQVVLDEFLGKAATNRFLARPEDAITHSIFVAGSHFYGKVALTEPQNFAVGERVDAAQAPNIGYLAQVFEVGDAEKTKRALQSIGLPYRARSLPAATATVETRDLSSASRAALQVRVPGSGAFALLLLPAAS